MSSPAATPSALTGVVLMLTDTDAARSWYESLGFAYLRGYDGMHWVGLGDVEIMLHPAETSSGGGGLCLHAGVADVAALFARAVELGLTPYDHQQPGAALSGPVTRPWGAVEFELDDPGGHRWIFTAS